MRSPGRRLQQKRREEPGDENEIDFQLRARTLGFVVLICHCHRVNDRVIRSAAEAGARTCEDIGEACGAGTGCGGCKPAIEGVLVTARAAEGGASLPIICAPEPGT